MEGDILTLEQHFQLRQLRLEIEDYSREELIQTVIEERQMLLIERQIYRNTMDAAGFDMGPAEGQCMSVPQTEEDLVEVFGRVPSNEELAAYLNDQLEGARMDEIDIEAIALGLEE